MTPKQEMAKARKQFEKATKLSEIALLALDDMEKIIASPVYSINMLEWHAMDELGKCNVCLAGSTMAQRFIGDPTRSASPEDFSEKTENKLLALNHFRIGGINHALEELGGDLRISEYANQRFANAARDFGRCSFNKREAKRFVKNMRKMAVKLQGMGL